MNEPAEDDQRFLDEIQRQAQRARQARGTSFWRGLAAVGGIGWMVVVPAVAGALLGRRLDERFETGIFWTLSLLVFGAMIGSASAWRHVCKELDP